MKIVTISRLKVRAINIPRSKTRLLQRPSSTNLSCYYLPNAFAFALSNLVSVFSAVTARILERVLLEIEQVFSFIEYLTA